MTRTVLIALVVSTALKLALLWPAAGLPYRGDELQYVVGAASIAETGVPRYAKSEWDEAHSSPVYPYTLGLLFKILGADGFVLAARILQVLASALSVLLIYQIAARAFDRRTAEISAAVAAFFPTFVAYTHYLFTETLFTFFLLGIAAVLVARPAPPTLVRALAAGAIAGVAALTRSAFVAQAPFVLLWIFVAGDGDRRRRIVAASAFAAGMFLVIAPWSVRNTVRYEKFLLIDTNAGNVLHKNWNAIRQENHDVGMVTRWQRDRIGYRGSIPFRARVEEADPIDRNNAEIRAAVGFVLAHPVLFARNCVIRAAEMVNPTSFLVRSIRHLSYSGIPPALGEIVIWLVVLSTMAVLLFGTIGVAARPPNDAALLLWLLVLANVAISVLIVSMSRYRFPMMPLLIPFAVDAARRVPRWFEPGAEAGPGVAAAVLLPLLIWAWVLYLPFSF